MTDPTLTEQLEIEAAETAAVLAADDPGITQPVIIPEEPAAPKTYYKPNRKDRRRMAALARKERKEKQRGRK